MPQQWQASLSVCSTSVLEGKAKGFLTFFMTQIKSISLCSLELKSGGWPYVNMLGMQKTKPMGVGGIGMLSTANYVARRYGVRSAM